MDALVYLLWYASHEPISSAYITSRTVCLSVFHYLQILPILFSFITEASNAYKITPEYP